MKNSIISSFIRSFFVSLGVIAGIGAGVTLLIILLVLLFGREDEKIEVKSYYAPTVIANAQDVRKTLSSTAPVILKLNISGIIGTEKLNMHTIKQQLIESREGAFKNNRVKALLLHINSPGGTVNDADGIYRTIKEYKERYHLPVLAYIDGLCASGGIYVAAAADHIYATDVSQIGSVGVITLPFFNVTKLMEKIGVETITLFAGKGKDDLNPFRTWKSGEEESFKSIINFFYQHFVDVVVENRPEIKRTDLVNDYGARVFPAEKALEYGFIDGIDYSINDAIEQLAKEIGIEDDYYQVVKLERKFTFPAFLREVSPMMTGMIKHRLELSPELDPNLMNKFLYLYLPNR